MYIYKYLNDSNDVIYVGKSINWKNRLNQHRTNDKKMMREVSKVYIMKCQDRIEMDILELYFIQLYNPKFNKKDTGYKIPSILLVNKKWELVLNYGDEDNSSIEYFNPSKNQLKKLFSSKLITTELAIEIIEAFRARKSLSYIYALIMFNLNYGYNEAMNELESIFCC